MPYLPWNNTNNKYVGGIGYKGYVVDPEEVKYYGRWNSIAVRVGDRWFDVHPPAPEGSLCYKVNPKAYWVRWELNDLEIKELIHAYSGEE